MVVPDKFRLDGRTAVVTGGNRGIGNAIARGMAEASADVVIANRDAESGQEAAEWAAAGVRVNNICPGYVIDGGYTVR